MPYLHPDDVLARAVAWAECQADLQAEPLGDAGTTTAGTTAGTRSGRSGCWPGSWRRPGRSGVYEQLSPAALRAYPVIAITDLAEPAEATIGERSEDAAGVRAEDAASGPATTGMTRWR